MMTFNMWELLIFQYIEKPSNLKISYIQSTYNQYELTLNFVTWLSGHVLVSLFFLFLSSKTAVGRATNPGQSMETRLFHAAGKSTEASLLLQPALNSHFTTSHLVAGAYPATSGAKPPVSGSTSTVGTGQNQANVSLVLEFFVCFLFCCVWVG